MRKFILCVFFLGLNLVGFGKCDEPGETALQVVQKAIKAHGGAPAIAKLNTAYVKSTIKGTLPKLGPMDMTMEDTFALPDRFRKALKAKISGQDVAITWAIDGDKCWYKENERPVMDIKSERGADSQYHPLNMVQQLVGVVDNANLRLLPDRQVEGQALASVEVTKEGKVLGTLTFDKGTGLLARGKSSKVIPFLSPDKQLESEIIFKDYTKTVGLNVPMKQLIMVNGQKMMEIDILEFKLLEKLDYKLFEKPGK